MVSLLIAAVLSQSAPAPRGPVAVVVVSKRPGADAFSSKVAARVLEVAKREGIGALLDDATAAKELKAGGFSDPKSCDGAQSCLVKLAVVLGARAVVIGVDVGKVAKSLAIHLEAVTADGETTLLSVDLTAPADAWGDKLAADITRFTRKVKEQLVPAGGAVADLKPEPKPEPRVEPKPEVKVEKVEPKPEVKVAKVEPVKEPVPPRDAPVEAKLEPRPRDADVEVEDTSTGPAPKVLPWALAGGTVLTAGAAVGLAAVGLGDKARYDASLVKTPDGATGTTLTQADAQALGGAVNTKMTMALASAVVSALLGGATVWAFTRD